MSSDKKEKVEDDLKVEICQICCDIYNITSRRKVKCNFCFYKCCASCFKRYCLSSISEPHCMSCKKKWSREFLCSFLTKTFINNEFKKHQEDLLLEREMSMLPSTQYYLECKEKANEFLKMSQDVDKEIIKLQEKHNNYLRLYSINLNKYLYPKNHKEEKEERKTVTFTKPCPVDGCRGFINNKWNCGVCSVKVCNECHEIKKEEHKCNEDVVKSVKLLKIDSKPCPKCYTPIHKLLGCDQMWCPICKTAFSWDTGKIINGPVHNPHYFEYLRTIGREDEEIYNRFEGNVCNRGINATLDRINRLNRRSAINNRDKFVLLYNYSQHLYHIDHVEIPRYNNTDTQEIQNVDLRIEYLENKIDANNMKIKIQRRNKKILYNQNITEIIRMYYDVSLDLINDYLINVETENDDWKDFYEKIKKLKVYTDENINKIKEIYGYKSFTNLTFEV